MKLYSKHQLYSPLSFLLLIVPLFNLDAQTVISGTVKDVDTGVPIEGAEIFYMFNDLPLSEGLSDEQGSYTMMTKLGPGRSIRVIGRHKDYKEITIDGMTWDEAEKNNIINLRMVPNSSQGPGSTPVSGFIYNQKKFPKKKLALNKVQVSFIDPKSLRKIEAGKSDKDGYFNFYPDADKGDKINIYFYKNDFDRFDDDFFVGTDNKIFIENVLLSHTKRPLFQKCLCAAGIIGTAFTIYSKNKSNKIYNDYKDAYSYTSDKERQDDYTSANNWNYGFQAGLIGSGLSLGTCLFYKRVKTFYNKRVKTFFNENEGTSQALPKSHINIEKIADSHRGTGVNLIYEF